MEGNDKKPNKFDAGKRFNGGKKDGRPVELHINKRTQESILTPHINNDPVVPGKVRKPEPNEFPNNKRFKQWR
ncbi:MAG TPA: hypothetical protein VL053_01545 [Arachidicoccus sp.]|nr:hypothetical protein [Arachidicoccus sp.]